MADYFTDTDIKEIGPALVPLTGEECQVETNMGGTDALVLLKDIYSR